MTVQTRYTTTLNGDITDAQVTLNVDAAPANNVGYGTINRGGATEEDIKWTGVAGLQLTGLLRGLSKTALTDTEVVGLKQIHLDEESVEGTLLHYIVNNKADLDESETYTGNNTFSGTNTFANDKARSTTNAAPTNELSFANKKYVNDQDTLKANLAGGNTFSGNQIFADNTAQTTTNAAPNAEKILANKKYVDDQIGGITDVKTKVSANDTTTNHLSSKIANDASSYLTWTEVNDGGNETLRGDIDRALLIKDFYPTKTGIADESLTTGQHLAEIPYDCQWFTQLTEATLVLGDNDARRKYSIKFTPPKTVTSWTLLYMRMAEQVNGATAIGDMTFRIETDNAGQPSGTLGHANATATVSQVTQRTWNTTFATRTITWAGAVSLTKGTVYHLVIAGSATDAANYLKIGVNSTYDENYCTFTRQTYDQGAGTWGNSVTNATPFFWADIALGAKLVPVDANFGRRIWNYVGVSSGNYSADAAVTYYYDIVPSTVLTSVPVEDSDYYIAEAVGTVSTTLPNNLYGQNFAYKVGKGVLTSSSTVDFKIETGVKKSWGTAQPTGSATTTHAFITWFSPSTVKFEGSYLSTANIIDYTTGYFDGTNNYSTGSRITNGGAPIALGIYTSGSFGGTAAAGAYWNGVAGSRTLAGFNYVVTKTSTPSDYSLIWEATA